MGRIRLLHDGFVSELGPYLLDALHVGVDDLAALVAIAVGYVVTPLYQVKLQEKFEDVNRGNQVYESEADSLLGSEVFW